MKLVWCSDIHLNFLGEESLDKKISCNHEKGHVPYGKSLLGFGAFTSEKGAKSSSTDGKCYYKCIKCEEFI